ncbi:MAG: cyclic nucleotide-binding domain-containing protein [Xenococcaceae cyanobacterium MO_234.B1]|nr:cyclic nucleotide-binding domain-containing protein [Xenococcaceae cyanobacterium MO_234.B1]
MREVDLSEIAVSETIILKAFLAGIVSACSMPLGSVTSLFWSPRNRILAFLIAFGGGALLAALVIDLVGSAREKGHLLELVIGSIIGSLFFTLVNRMVNDSGGFLRKPSTTLVHMTQKETQRFQQRIARLRRINLFRNLSLPERQALAKSLLVSRYPKGATVYSQEDPSESLYIIEKGQVELLDPQAELSRFTLLSTNDTFGKFAFLTGSPHKMVAVTTQETQLDILPRPDFEQLLQTSPRLVEATEQLLQSESVASYLQQRHQLTVLQVRDWIASAIISLRQKRIIPPPINVENHSQEFLNLARQIRRFPVFKHLPEADLREIADRLVYRHFEDGYAFFQPQELSDRLYIIARGEVEVLNPNTPRKKPLILSWGDALGELSFVTGAPHTVTAVAKTDVAVWVLRKQDFEEMLQQSKDLETEVSRFLEQPKITEYLQKRQHFEPNKAGAWVQQALKNMNAGQLIPSATAISGAVQQHEEAPIAIWVGLLMDGIPEALTIGAHIVSAPISPSLLAGLFISNYPEAFSSSAGMKHQGFSIPRILLMWTSIMLITGILAAVGSVAFAEVPESIVSLLESIAAGAMLTVISETMLPEAYAKGGSIVGISTLLGFLVIILIKSLD